MITVKDLSKQYRRTPVLSGVSADFPAGRLTSLIGPNGAGKSTLLMQMARLAEIEQGTILLEGQPISEISVREYARRVATLRQAPGMTLRLTVGELVAFGRFPHSRGVLTGDDRRAIDAAIDFLSLAPLRDSFVDELSGGQRQMAFLAMTIAQETSCLLLDEPLTALDMQHSVQIMQALRSLCDDHGKTVIVVIHDINFAANYSDHIVAMKQGRVQACGSVADVVTETRLRDLYGIDFDIQETPRGRLCNYFTPKGAVE